jgi:hypothetical protein
MLELDDQRWSQLDDAYHTATKIPALIDALYVRQEPVESSEDEPWFSLWSALCHQDDVYTASYATVPHLVGVALRSNWPLDCGFLHLPTAIEIARNKGNGPPIPEFLEVPYRLAISNLRQCVHRFANQSMDRDFVQISSAALAVANSQHKLADAIMNLDDFWIEKIVTFDFD